MSSLYYTPFQSF